VKTGRPFFVCFQEEMEMAARFGSVLATRVEPDVERELKRRARDDDRPLSAWLRRALTAMAQNPSTAGRETRSGNVIGEH
jgi:hypothetical protein